MKRHLVLAGALLAFLVALSLPLAAQASSSAAPSGEIRVFAAASLTEAFKAEGAEFTARYPACSIVFNFAGSQALARQLEQGASADVFASADWKQMDVAVKAGRVATGVPVPFARNRLVAIASLEPRRPMNTLADYAQSGIKLVLAAETVPVGAYSRVFLEKAAADPAYGESYRKAFFANVVSLEENVRAVLAKVSLSEADGGIVYSSDLNAAAAATVKRIEIPDALNVIGEYPLAPVADAKNATAAAAFVNFILSDRGQAILANFGLVSVR